MRSINLKLVFWAAGSFFCLSTFCLGASLSLLFSRLPALSLLLALCGILVVFSLRWRLCLALLFLVLGITWASYKFSLHIDNAFPQAFERVDFNALGSVEGLVTTRAGNYQFYFRIKSIDAALPSNLLGEKLKLSCYRCPFVIRAGQTWRFTLRVKRPRSYASWAAFDYEKYLFRHRVIAKGYVRTKGSNTLVNETRAIWTDWRHRIRESISSKVESSVGRDIILALAIGDKSGFSNAQRRVFQQTGTSHLMAISGLHIGLVFIFVSALFRFILWPFARIYEYIPRPTLVMFPALLCAVVYSALAGFAVSTQRALLMLAVYVVCRLIARQTSLIRVLLIAMTVLILIDPFSVMDVGFWLSCGAVLVIGLIGSGAKTDSSQVVEKTSLLKLQPLLWLGMLPITIGFFGQVSLISPLVNLVLVPLFCSVLVPLTLIGVCVDAVGLHTASLWWLTHLSFAFSQLYVGLDWLSGLSFASAYVSDFIWWQWALLLLALLSYLNRDRIKTGLPPVFSYFTQTLCVLLVASIFFDNSRSLEDDQLNVVLLDVGQGLAMVIETANSVMVYDTGPKYTSGFTTAEAVLLPYLRSRGIRRIDTLVISHADNDHIGGYHTVLNAMQVDQVLSSRLDRTPNAKPCRAGDKWQIDHTHVSVLSPQDETPDGSNNRSCVLMLEHFGTKVLLSGDIEKQVERFLVDQHFDKLAADILLVPHQGSKTSSTAKFLDAVQPSLAFLAAGYKNHYGHPHQSVVQRYLDRDVDLYSTIESGSILLKINQHGWQIEEYRKSQQRFWQY